MPRWTKHFSWVNTQGLANGLTFLAIIAAGITFIWTKSQDRMRQDAELRLSFIDDAEVAEVSMWIGHRDSTLTLVLEKLNSAPDLYHPGLLTPGERMVRQQLDGYFNYLETVASLWQRGWLSESDFRGLWRYYLLELYRWPLLWRYVSTEEYEWKDLLWAIDEFQKDALIQSARGDTTRYNRSPLP